MERRYRIGQVAKLTGVSVRTLHHYDQIGLLEPRARSKGGDRLYVERDLLTLQQVLTLRYLGFRLKEIRDLLGRPHFDLAASLRVQQRVLEHRAGELDRIRGSLQRLLQHHEASGEWDWDLVVKTSALTQEELLRSTGRMKEEEKAKLFEEWGRQFTPEQVREGERMWAELMADLRASRDLDPASLEAQALLDRYNGMIEYTFGGNGGLMQAVGENYQQGAYEHIEGAAQKEDFELIQKLQAAHKGR